MVEEPLGRGRDGGGVRARDAHLGPTGGAEVLAPALPADEYWSDHAPAVRLSTSASRQSRILASRMVLERQARNIARRHPGGALGALSDAAKPFECGDRGVKH